MCTKYLDAFVCYDRGVNCHGMGQCLLTLCSNIEFPLILDVSRVQVRIKWFISALLPDQFLMIHLQTVWRFSMQILSVSCIQLPYLQAYCLHNRYMLSVHFCCTCIALKTCASVINGRHALLIAKGLREKNICPEKRTKEANKIGWLTIFFSPQCLGLLWCQICILFIMRILICFRQTTPLVLMGVVQLQSWEHVCSRTGAQWDWLRMQCQSWIGMSLFSLACHSHILEAEVEGWYKSVTHSFTL